MYIGAATAEVWGSLFTLDPSEKPALDAAEGSGYYEVMVEVESLDGRRRRARMYRAREERWDPGLRPYRWYRDYVVAGAEYHGLPESYVQAIRSVPVKEDPDRGRARMNQIRRLGMKR